jgi:hypothetical protein
MYRSACPCVCLRTHRGLLQRSGGTDRTARSGRGPASGAADPVGMKTVITFVKK